MDTRRITKLIEGILEPILSENGLDLIEVTLKNEGGRWILRVTIDCEGGVTVDHCSLVSRELAVHLDVEDPVPVKYYLEVSSPGLDRPLKDEKDFERFAGRPARIKLHRSVAGRRKVQGTLEGLLDGKVLVRLDDRSLLEIPIEDISSARLDYSF